MGTDQRRPVPARPAAAIVERALCPRLQRDQEFWRRVGLAENARLFALLNMGIANTFITDWDAKFTYNLWRPVTAIRNGDQDGNDATERDAGWTSLNAVPMHPEYPSQAAIVAGVSMGILEAVFGPNIAIAVTATDLMNPKLQRRFSNVQQMADETQD